MSTNSRIEWTDASWNPIRARDRVTGKFGWHCERYSPGCTNCYAETFNGRMLPNGGTGFEYVRGSRDRVETFVDDAVLAQPLRWRKAKRVFVCSMTDLFGEWVTDEQIDSVFAVMAWTPRHTFQVLTKRPERMRAWIRDTQTNVIERGGWFRNPENGGRSPGRNTKNPTARGTWPLPNVWLGVSVEDQKRADERIPVLMDTPAAVHFLSVEPLLEEVDLQFDAGFENGLHWVDAPRPDWVIVGGESGPGARVCHVDWIRSIVQQCKAASVACFLKQLGAEPHANTPPAVLRPGGPATYAFYAGKDRKGGDIAAWPEDLRVRQFPAVLP